MSREHARPQPPAASWPPAAGTQVGRGASPGPDGHPGAGAGQGSNPAAHGPSWAPGPPAPGPRPGSPSQPPLDPGGERWPNPRPLAPLMAQLVTPHPETETGGARQGAQRTAEGSTSHVPTANC
jgi:hypothetical protein